MSEHYLPGSPPVPVVLRQSARAKRLSLRVSRLDGRVTLTMPRAFPLEEALDFARSKENWIRSHLDKRPDECAVDIGATLPVEGVERQITRIKGRRVMLGEQEIGVPGGPVGPRLQSWLKELARDRLAAASDRYAARLGRGYTRLTLRDTRSRWGSCTSAGALMYSWRLILAAPEVLDYVAAHEVAHLAEMNHSPAFWSQVERIHGPYRAQRTWLRTHGNDLHRFRF